MSFVFEFRYEEVGRRLNCGGVATAVSVQTDMALPALCNFGSDELKRQFLAPSISGDFIGKLRSLLELNEFHYTKQQKLI